MGEIMSETILQEIYNEIKKIRGKTRAAWRVKRGTRWLGASERGLMFKVVIYKKVSKELRNLQKAHLRKFAELVEIIKTDPIP